MSLSIVSIIYLNDANNAQYRGLQYLQYVSLASLARIAIFSVYLHRACTHSLLFLDIKPHPFYNMIDCSCMHALFSSYVLDNKTYQHAQCSGVYPLLSIHPTTQFLSSMRYFTTFTLPPLCIEQRIQVLFRREMDDHITA